MTPPTSSQPARLATSPSANQDSAPPTPTPPPAQPGNYGPPWLLTTSIGVKISARSCARCDAWVMYTDTHDSFHARIGY